MLTHLPTAFTHATARREGLSDRQLAALVRDGALDRLGRGVYHKANAAPADTDLIELALRAPGAALCLITALAHHDLTDTIPTTVHVALPRSRRLPSVAAAVTWHRFKDETFALGLTSLPLDDGLHIGLYTPERSVIDAFHLRHLVGDDVAIGALKRWLQRPGAQPADLLRQAQAFPKATPSLLAALRALL
jgi:predicted transcriptional regulator of viral defense system